MTNAADVVVSDSQTPKNALANQQDTMILVVEDNAVNQLIVQKLLNVSGYRHHTVANGQECLNYLQEHSVDLVLMDCQMPVMDGYEATKRLRAQGFSAPIIALTANAQESDKQQCLTAGMNDFLSKPFKKDQLDKVIFNNLPNL